MLCIRTKSSIKLLNLAAKSNKLDKTFSVDNDSQMIFLTPRTTFGIKFVLYFMKRVKDTRVIMSYWQDAE